MKTPFAIIFILLAGIGGFYAGNLSHPTDTKESAGDAAARTRPRGERLATRSTPSRDEAEDERLGRMVLSVDKARRMTPTERIALLKKAATLSDADRQAAILCGLIPAMSAEELTESTDVLIKAQGRGNAWSQEVWNELWLQWGRLDPEGCLARAGYGKGLVTGEDYRLLMAGWLETSPNSAVEWAKANSAQATSQMSEAIAFALMREAGGDVKKMEQAILSVAGNTKLARTCLQEYFDLLPGASAGGKALPDAYAGMSADLRAAAWPVVMYRMSYADRDQAKAWLEQQAGDPGRDYNSTYGMLWGMSQKDPKDTAEWASRLPKQAPGDVDAERQHPATVSLSYWMQRDPQAAAAWVSTQPPDSPWAVWHGKKIAKNSGEDGH